jgi:phage repressor protein C with HTH and peptisase S24 domain
VLTIRDMVGVVDPQEALRRRVQKLMDDRGMQQQDFAKLMNRSGPWASMFLSGLRKGDLALAQQIADAFGVTLTSLLEEEPLDVSDYKPEDIPVMGEAEATRDGLIIWSDEGVVTTEVAKWISRPPSIRDKQAYGLIVKGDSMVPRYFPGELIIASPRATVKSGSFVCAMLKTGGRMIKRAYRQEDGWNLVSINEAYPPRFVQDADIAAIHKVVHNSHDA